jgi:hypothetical protein
MTFHRSLFEVAHDVVVVSANLRAVGWGLSTKSGPGGVPGLLVLDRSLLHAYRVNSRVPGRPSGGSTLR